jgi:hypothetical protein
MEPEKLRYYILELMGQHEANDKTTYLEDKDIATRLAVALDDVQRALLILENHQFVDLAKAMGPSFGARLTPTGMEALEAASQQPVPSRVIGF